MAARAKRWSGWQKFKTNAGEEIPGLPATKTNRFDKEGNALPGEDLCPDPDPFMWNGLIHTHNADRKAKTYCQKEFVREGGYTVGPPRRTRYFSVEQLEAQGIIGIYREPIYRQ